MSYIHYDRYPVVLDRTIDYSTSAPRFRTDKPVGLWFSDTSVPDEGWADWCRREEWGVDDLACPHEITFTPTARIYTITNLDELDDFAQTYKNDTERFEHTEGPDMVYGLDWDRLYGTHDGILITPHLYHWTDRVNLWYYGWDCASGCVWNLKAINTFTLLTLPPGKTDSSLRSTNLALTTTG